MGALVGLLRNRGLRNGVIGGNRRWLTIWAVIVSAQVLHRLLKTKPVVAKYELKPGETVTVTDLGVTYRDL